MTIETTNDLSNETFDNTPDRSYAVHVGHDLWMLMNWGGVYQTRTMTTPEGEVPDDAVLLTRLGLLRIVKWAIERGYSPE